MQIIKKDLNSVTLYQEIILFCIGLQILDTQHHTKTRKSGSCSFFFSKIHMPIFERWSSVRFPFRARSFENNAHTIFVVFSIVSKIFNSGCVCQTLSWGTSRTLTFTLRHFQFLSRLSFVRWLAEKLLTEVISAACALQSWYRATPELPTSHNNSIGMWNVVSSCLLRVFLCSSISSLAASSVSLFFFSISVGLFFFLFNLSRGRPGNLKAIAVEVEWWYRCPL